MGVSITAASLLEQSGSDPFLMNSAFAFSFSVYKETHLSLLIPAAYR